MSQQPTNPTQQYNPQQTTNQGVNSKHSSKAFFIPIITALIGAAAIIIAAFIGGGKTLIIPPTPIPTAITEIPPSLPVLEQQNVSLPGSTNPNAVHFKSLVKTGDVIIVAITHFQTGNISIKDNHLNDKYISVLTNPLFAHQAPNADYVELYYANNVTGGDTTISVTFKYPPGIDPNTEDSNVGIYEFSGLDKTLPLGPIASQYGTGAAPNGGTLNTPQNNELIFVVGVDSGLDNQDDPNVNTPANPGKGYQMLSLDHPHWDSVNYERFYAEYQIATLGTHNSDFSLKYSSQWAVIGVIFKV